MVLLAEASAMPDIGAGWRIVMIVFWSAVIWAVIRWARGGPEPEADDADTAPHSAERTGPRPAADDR